MDEVYRATADEVAQVSDDLTEQLAREQLARHAMAGGRCTFCGVHFPCGPFERAETALNLIARHRRDRQRDGL